MTDTNTYRYFNPNPAGNNTHDCAIRAICAVFNIPWDVAFDMLAERAKQMGVTMDDNAVYGSILRQNGFNRAVIPNSCPDCYSARDFCYEHPTGVYVLGFSNHVAAVIDGRVWDSFDSTTNLIPTYYWFEIGDANNGL